MRRWPPLLLCLGLILVPALLLLRYGSYGWTLFLAVPFFLGGVAGWFARPKTAAAAGGAGALAGVAAGFSLLLFGLEGLFCILMSLPLTLTLGALGGFLAHCVRPRQLGASGAVALLLLPMGTLGFDLTARPPVFEVRTAIDIAAPPEIVWQHVVTFSELPEPAEWYFRSGIAYPMRARIQGSGPGSVRYCEFSTGPFVEPIEVWNQPRLLRFSVTANPAPMHEWSPYARVLPKHLHGYLVSKRGQFLLTPLPGGGTRLEGATRYQHGLWPAQYWRLWSDAIIHRIHLRVLQHIRRLAEG